MDYAPDLWNVCFGFVGEVDRDIFEVINDVFTGMGCMRLKEMLFFVNRFLKRSGNLTLILLSLLLSHQLINIFL